MAFIGNTVQNQGFTPAIDYFNGNGVTVTFTLSRPIASVTQVIVAVDNVIQNPSSAFGVVGNSITFTSAPLSGTNNIWVEYTSLITTYQGISQDPTVIGDIRATGGYLAEGDFGNSFIDGNLIDYVTGRGRFTVGELDDITFYHGGTGARSEMMDLYYAGGAKIYGTTALTIPVGTTGQRPGTSAIGMIRMNTTTGYPEWYDTTTSNWIQFNKAKPFLLDYLVIAGGGGGGRGNTASAYSGGGGGAGGYRTSAGTTGGGGAAESQLTLTPGVSYTVTVGDGGAAAVSANTAGSSGSNSVFATITSTGGGYGAAGFGGGAGANGGSGGSGGGAGNTSTVPYPSGTAGSRTASPVQGFDGGTAAAGAGNGGGGGGGAGALGNNGTSLVGANGGAGLVSTITGSSVTRAGGGAGAGNTGGTGGSGGGGNGGATSTSGTAGSTNTGSGGGGGANDSSSAGAGGSGVVIIKYPDVIAISNPGGGLTYTTATSGGYSVTTFTAGTGSVVFA